MKSGSWSSYRAAMPSECFGEPDDDERGPRNPGPPVLYEAVWYDLVETGHMGDGGLSVALAECGRSFPADAHHDAFAAAKRWAIAMGKRQGGGWVRETFRDGELHEVRVWPPLALNSRVEF